jgi:hypothetical protein
MSDNYLYHEAVAIIKRQTMMLPTVEHLEALRDHYEARMAQMEADILNHGKQLAEIARRI